MIMSDEKLPLLARQIVKNPELVQYMLDPRRLEDALRRAIAEFRPDAEMYLRRERAAELLPKLRGVVASLATARKKWEKLADDDRLLVAQFVGDDFTVDGIDQRFTFLADLFDEFEIHHRRERGNQGNARVGDKRDLKPLFLFVRVLMDFWAKETGKPFGHKIENSVDVDDGVWEPTSPAMEFLDHASGCLGGYAVNSLETVVRDIKRAETGRT